MYITLREGDGDATDGVYEIYTLPHTEEDVLTKLTVTALDANFSKEPRNQGKSVHVPTNIPKFSDLKGAECGVAFLGSLE